VVITVSLAAAAVPAATAAAAAATATATGSQALALGSVADRLSIAAVRRHPARKTSQFTCCLCVLLACLALGGYLGPRHAASSEVQHYKIRLY
jgi:hypothetical protein